MDSGYSSPPGEAVYVPWAQVSHPQVSIVVQPRSSRDAAVAAVRRALHNTDPVIAANNIAPLAALVNQANALTRLQTILMLTFALVAISMVVLGSYGVMTQLVTSREREFALRLLFGAMPSSLGTSVLLQVGRLTAPGALIGIAAVWLLGEVLKPFVFGVDPHSVTVLAGVTIGIIALASAAALPAMARAMRVDVRKSALS